MTEQSGQGWNLAAFVLYALLIPAAFFEFTIAAFAFGMSTDACYDAACDASHHASAGIATVLIGIGVVLVATLAVMIRGATRQKLVIGWPFAGLLGLAIAGAIGTAVVH